MKVKRESIKIPFHFCPNCHRRLQIKSDLSKINCKQIILQCSYCQQGKVYLFNPDYKEEPKKEPEGIKNEEINQNTEILDKKSENTNNS